MMMSSRWTYLLTDAQTTDCWLIGYLVDGNLQLLYVNFLYKCRAFYTSKQFGGIFSTSQGKIAETR